MFAIPTSRELLLFIRALFILLINCKRPNSLHSILVVHFWWFFQKSVILNFNIINRNTGHYRQNGNYIKKFTNSRKAFFTIMKINKFVVENNSIYAINSGIKRNALAVKSKSPHFHLRKSLPRAPAATVISKNIHSNLVPIPAFLS